jgi:TetR/AcrR family transcriptional repressor of nem operon
VARTKEFDPQKALSAAVEVFWRNGYEKTSLDDLIAQMNVDGKAFTIPSATSGRCT